MFRNLLTALLLILVVAGCLEKKRPQPPQSNQVRIGADPCYQPFEFRNDITGELAGFDIDLMSEICRLNGWEYEFIVVPFEELLPGLASGRFDIGISAITITSRREAVVAFSDPYFLAGQTIAVPVDDTTTRAIEDLRGKRVGVQTGTTCEELAKGTDGLLVYPYKNIGAAFEDLASGRLDAVVNDLPNTRAHLEKHDHVKVIPAPLNAERYAIALRMGDDERVGKVNSALQALKDDGIYDQLYLKWFGDYRPPDMVVPDSIAGQ